MERGKGQKSGEAEQAVCPGHGQDSCSMNSQQVQSPASLALWGGGEKGSVDK